MIQVYRIPVPKERLRAMPKDERVLLLLLGYVANQVSMLQKLLTFATNRTPAEELEQHASGAQTQMLVRLTVGALNEAWELVRTRFIENTMAQDYLNPLDPAGQEAFTALKRQFSGSNLLNKIRKNYAFHYPYSDDVEIRIADGARLDQVCFNGSTSTKNGSQTSSIFGASLTWTMSFAIISCPTCLIHAAAVNALANSTRLLEAFDVSPMSFFCAASKSGVPAISAIP